MSKSLAGITFLSLFIFVNNLYATDGADGVDKSSDNKMFQNAVNTVAVPKVETANSAVYKLGKMLRCPVCQGQPIAESPSDMAQAMMTRIRDMKSAGKKDDEIIKYFVDRYGEWVLLKPKASGFNLLVWILPPIILIIGLLLVINFIRGKVDVDKNSSTAQNFKQNSKDLEKPTESSTNDKDDEYVKAVRDIVNQYSNFFGKIVR